MLFRSEAILEIGAGLGELTFELAALAKNIIAVEKDTALTEILKRELTKRNINNVELITGDILKLPKELFKRISPYQVVANIPYYLTARLVRKLLQEVKQPENIVITIQKEVAKRITSRPPRMNLIAVSVQVYGEPKILFPISKKSFWPEPEVDSACIAIQNISRQKFIEAGANEKSFFKIVRAAFQGKRKMLVNSLSQNLKIRKEETLSLIRSANIDIAARPESIPVAGWLELTSLLAKKLPQE